MVMAARSSKGSPSIAGTLVLFQATRSHNLMERSCEYLYEFSFFLSLLFGAQAKKNRGEENCFQIISEEDLWGPGPYL
jgi:hypothetical protein